MKDYVKDAWNIIDQAFGPPVYSGKRWCSKLKSQQSINNFIHAMNILEHGQAAYGEDKHSNFILGVLYKYFKGKNTEYLNQMRKAIEYDPNFLEAIIALRDGEMYIDPFCYPKWDDLRNRRTEFRSSILYAETKSSVFDFVRYNNSNIIPAIVLKYPNATFRAPLDNNTVIRIILSIEAVPPSMPALMSVFTIIFDDINDPFFSASNVNLFPIEMDINGIQMIPPPDYQPWDGRDIGRRFCQEPFKCALYLLDMQNEVKLARIIEFGSQEIENFHEMDKVLQILSNEKIGYLTWKQASGIHEKCCVREIQNPVGRTIRIPSWGDPNQAKKFIFPIILRNDRIMLKETEKFSKWRLKILEMLPPWKIHEIFISHAHTDSKWAYKIEEWLNMIWPSLRVFLTVPINEKKQNSKPFDFLNHLNRSKCLIFLATPRSIGRPMVVAETTRGKIMPIISVLAGGSTLKDIEKLLEDQYNGIDVSKVVILDDQSDWDRFARLLANELHLALPGCIPHGPLLDPIDVCQSRIEDPLKFFLEDYMKLLKIPDKQTDSDAEELLEMIDWKLMKIAEKEGESFKPYGLMYDEDLSLHENLIHRLLCILLIIPDKNVVLQFLDSFPALVDNEMLRLLENWFVDNSNFDVELQNRSKSLLQIVQKKLSKNINDMDNS